MQRLRYISVEDYLVVGGNPAKIIKKRVLKGTGYERTDS